MEKKSTGIKQAKNTMLRLAGIFTAAIVVPGFILCLISLRTSLHEEAFIEKQLNATFQAELTQSVYGIQQLLDKVQQELDTMIPANATRSALILGDDGRSLVDVPFIFNRRGHFILPDGNHASGNEKEFLLFNGDFFMDRKSVEVYRSISDEYIDTILSFKNYDNVSNKSNYGKEASRNLAASEFDQDSNVQQRVYSDLKKKGKLVPYRNIVSGSKNSARVEAYSPQLSTYITESMRFSQIVATSSSGLIPRIIDEQMMLIYWKKNQSDLITGCSIKMDRLAERINAVLPQVLNKTRFLTVLDQNGKPIIHSETFMPPEWKKTFAAREISRLLPRWEVAIYLANPQIITSRARQVSLSILLLVVTLFTVIVVSGFVLLRSVNSEIRLARQKTTFVTNVSHELKTPLTSIRLFAELLRERRQPDPAKQEKYLSIMLSEIERLTRLINNVLDFARINKGTRTYSKRICDCSELCRELVENQRVRLEHNGFKIETEYSEKPLFTNIDSEAIKQAILNVLSNAEKYSSQEKWIGITISANGSNVNIAIADRGIGIDQSQSELIFKEFYRIDDSLTAKVQGTGLGLTITRQILHDHDGEITYRKNEPTGSVFVVTIPVAEEKINVG
jgi:signal transduction histidine kinase